MERVELPPDDGDAAYCCISCAAITLHPRNVSSRCRRWRRREGLTLNRSVFVGVSQQGKQLSGEKRKRVGYVAGRGVPGVYCGHTRLPVCTLYLLWVQPMRQFAMVVCHLHNGCIVL